MRLNLLRDRLTSGDAALIGASSAVISLSCHLKDRIYVKPLPQHANLPGLNESIYEPARMNKRNRKSRCCSTPVRASACARACP